MLNLAPLPSWRSLLFAFFGRVKTNDDWKLSWKRNVNEVVGCLSRSAWSLALVVQWRQCMGPGRQVCIWIPDYYCNSTLMPLRQLGVRLHFYPVTDELEPDYVQIRERAKLTKPDIFVFVHYFGYSKPTSRVREFCNRHDSWLVEDAAHMLFPTGNVGKEGDFVLYSPHKLIGTPAGGVLVVRPDGASHLGLQGLSSFGLPETWASQLAMLAAGNTWIFETFEEIAWTGKRLLQKVGVRKKAALSSFHDANPPVAGLPTPTMSGYALKLLISEASRSCEILRRRQRNLMMLDELLSGQADSCLIPVVRPTIRESMPYMAAYECAHKIEDLYHALRKKGLPAVTWPDLPLEVIAEPQQYATATSLKRRRIYLPIHQSLRTSKLFQLLSPKALRLEGDSITINWDACAQTQWEEWMQNVELPNLLQSWCYGEAKAVVDGWKVRRAVISTPREPIGCVQILQKKVGGLLTLTRINRGPLFLPSIPPALRLASLQTLCRELSGWRRGRLLSCAPELPLSGRSLIFLEQCGIRQFVSKSWNTSLIDLHLNEAQLRDQATGRWRNMLAAAQRQEMTVECLEDEVDFEALLTLCQQMLNVRQVDFPSDLYRELRRQLILAKTPALLFAIRVNGEMIAAIWVVPHGSGATYLLGWSGTQGRSWNAHYLLLWEAMLRLRQLGIRWFDTGGLDDENASGIARFKLGLGGARHTLVGEGWCY